MYIFDAKLEDTDLKITRRFQVPEKMTICELGCAVITLFGFQGYHLMKIDIDGVEYEPDDIDNVDYDDDDYEQDADNSAIIEDAFGRNKEAYLYYDYGDGWVISLKIVKHTKEWWEDVKLLSGTGRGCIEDVGGTGGLENFIRVFQEKDEDYEEMCEWQGITEYDWENCYVDKINERLQEAIDCMCTIVIGGCDPYEDNEDFLEDMEKWYEEAFGVTYWSD